VAKKKSDQPRVEVLLADALEKAYSRRPETEFHFCDRGWRLDIAYPDQKIAVEIDGQHHLNYKRHREDCEKRNAAKELGWNVLAYPASGVTTKKRLPRIVEQIGRVLMGVADPDSAACVLVGD
jgi:hypothetical protein